MIKRFSNLSIRGKLIVAGLLPSMLVLSLAASAFAVYDLTSYRLFITRDVKETANFIALTTRAALSFEQADNADRILAGLESNPNVTRACIFDEMGAPFTEYAKAGVITRPLKSPERAIEGAERSAFHVFSPIILGDKQIGTVYVEGTLEGLATRIAILSAGLLTSLILLAALAYGVSARLQQHISRPLLSLARTARSVAEQKDYSVRAERQQGKDFSVLTEAFNQMLEQIERQNAELESRTAALQKANAELEAFTYTVSHDLRAPLRSISGFAQILMRSTNSLPEDAKDSLARIQKNAQRMAKLIDELLAFSQIDTQSLSIQPVNLDELVNEVASELIPHEKGRQIQWRATDLTSVEGDPALLRQVYANLISNALKYSRKSPVATIQIGSRAQNGETIFFVRDNGVGFDMKYSAKLFKIFERLHKVEQFEGTGVGLAIVQRIVQRHGGRIWAEAQPDKGATFYFTLGKHGKK